MLKELLPKLKENLLKTFQIKPLEVPEELQERNLSPNLLLPIDTKNLFIKAAPTVVKLTNYTVILVSTVLIVLLFSNLILDRKLVKLLEERDNLVEQIDMNSHIEKRAREVARLINLYKTKKSESPPVSEGLNFVIIHTYKHIKIDNLTYDRENNKYTLNARANTPTSFAYVISGLLSEDYVDSIVIKSVQLWRGNREYLAIFEVMMK